MADIGGGGQAPAGHNHSESSPGAGRLRLINLVIMQTIELNRQRSLLLSELHYNTDVSKQSYTPFYSFFLEVYELTHALLPAELDTKIKKWINSMDRSQIKDNAMGIRKEGLDLAEELIKKLSDLGLLQMFEEQVAPPFIFDFDLLAAKDKIAAADAQAALEAQQAEEAAKLAAENPEPEEEPAKKKKRRER